MLAHVHGTTPFGAGKTNQPTAIFSVCGACDVRLRRIENEDRRVPSRRQGESRATDRRLPLLCRWFVHCADGDANHVRRVGGGVVKGNVESFVSWPVIIQHGQVAAIGIRNFVKRQL